MYAGTACKHTQRQVIRGVGDVHGTKVLYPPLLLTWSTNSRLPLFWARHTSVPPVLVPRIGRARACEPTSSRIQGLLAARATAAHLSR